MIKLCALNQGTGFRKEVCVGHFLNFICRFDILRNSKTHPLLYRVKDGHPAPVFATTQSF